MNNLQAAAFLITDEGKMLLKKMNEYYHDKDDILRMKDKFDMPAELFQSALSIIEIRRKAVKKFTSGELMYFTRDGYEMASSEIIAGYRAKRFDANDTVYDLCCGIGGDLLELAKHVRKVIAVDIDEINLLYARENASIYGVSDKIEFVCDDVMKIDIPADANIFIDPSRRSEKNAGRNPDKYSPSLNWVFDIARKSRKIAVKVSPAIDFTDFSDYEIELLSSNHECRETLLWGGELKQYNRRATVLPSVISIDSTEKESFEISDIKKFLYEPDVAVIRAGLVTHLAGKYGLSRIDNEIAYLTGDNAVESPLLKGYKVETVLPWSLKTLNIFLRENSIGKVIIKKRGFPMLPDEVEKKLKLKGKRQATIILTRVVNEHFVIICDIK